MSWFSGIKMLFSADKAVDGIFDKDKGALSRIGSWIGNQQYTEEEKAEANAETRKWSIEFLNAMVPFKMAQRIIASIVMAIWGVIALNYLLCVYLDYILGSNLKTDIYAFATSDFMVFPTTCVLSLYFLGGVWPSRKKD